MEKLKAMLLINSDQENSTRRILFPLSFLFLHHFFTFCPGPSSFSWISKYVNGWVSKRIDEYASIRHALHKQLLIFLPVQTTSNFQYLSHFFPSSSFFVGKVCKICRFPGISKGGKYLHELIPKVQRLRVKTHFSKPVIFITNIHFKQNSRD